MNKYIYMLSSIHWYREFLNGFHIETHVVIKVLTWGMMWRLYILLRKADKNTLSQSKVIHLAELLVWSPWAVTVLLPLSFGQDSIDHPRIVPPTTPTPALEGHILPQTYASAQPARLQRMENKDRTSSEAIRKLIKVLVWSVIHSNGAGRN